MEKVKVNEKVFQDVCCSWARCCDKSTVQSFQTAFNFLIRFKDIFQQFFVQTATNPGINCSWCMLPTHSFCMLSNELKMYTYAHKSRQSPTVSVHQCFFLHIWRIWCFVWWGHKPPPKFNQIGLHGKQLLGVKVATQISFHFPAFLIESSSKPFI